MNCKQAQRDIALWVGQDLDDPRDRDNVKRHVTSCPDCREHYRRMKGALKVLDRAETPQTYVATGSLWPDLATRINGRESQVPRGRFNGWMPFVAMTAACFILMLVVNEQPNQQGPIGPPTAKGPVFTTPVMNAEGPFFHDPGSPPEIRFENRNAGDDARRLEEVRRDAMGDRY